MIIGSCTVGSNVTHIQGAEASPIEIWPNFEEQYAKQTLPLTRIHDLIYAWAPSVIKDGTCVSQQCHSIFNKVGHWDNGSTRQDRILYGIFQNIAQ